MRSKTWMLLSVLVVVVLVLAGCPAGGAPAQPPAAVETAPAEAPEAGGEATAPAETPTEAAEAAAPVGGDGPTLTIWADDTRAPVLEALGADFEAQYGVRIVVTQKEFGAIRDDLKIAGPAGEGPDIIIGAHDWLGELVENGLLAEIELGAMADTPAALSTSSLARRRISSASVTGRSGVQPDTSNAMSMTPNGM